MADLATVLSFGLLMAAIALVGSVTTLVPPRTLERWLLPLVAFAAGSLLGGAIFHMMPAAVERSGNTTSVWLWLGLGFLAFFVLEQFLEWQHSHRPDERRRRHGGRPLNWLILFADGLHNLLGGLSIGAVFAADLRLGITAWLAAAAHEVPQELGDFGVLVHGGWSRGRALAYNLLSAATFPVGMVVSWSVAGHLDVDWLIPFGAGNFLYIGCADLVPEVKAARDPRRAALHLVAFLAGLGLLLALRLLAHGHGDV